MLVLYPNRNASRPLLQKMKELIPFVFADSYRKVLQLSDQKYDQVAFLKMVPIHAVGLI